MSITEHHQLEQAIAALEGQRPVLGDAVVDASIAALREKLAALTAAPRDEQRKLVTILFADLAGWTAMSEQLDPEDVRATRQAYFAAVTPPIIEPRRARREVHRRRCAGRLRRAAGERGRPRARRAGCAGDAGGAGDAARRDVACNVSTDAHRRSHRRRGGHNRPAPADDFVVTGDTVNVAARLHMAAPPGGVLISHDTWRHMTGLFEVTVQAPMAFKGRAEPVRTYLVAGARPRPFRRNLQGVAGVQTRMIGRKTELELLQDALLTVMEDGQAQMVTVMGEAGVGKSRPLSEFEVWVDELPQEVVWFRGRATPESQSAPYSLLRDLFARRFQIEDSHALLEVRQKLEDGFLSPLRSSGRGGEVLEAKEVHLIGQLLGYDFGDSPFVKSLLDEPQRLREQALATLEVYFRALARQDPLAVVLEDIHWADNSSLDTLAYLLSRLDQVSLLVVAAGRPSLYQRRQQWGEGSAFHRRLDLQPLSKRAVGQLLDELLQRVVGIPGKLRQLVVEGADGNPFFVEELVKMLIEDGVIVPGVDDRSPWRVEAEGLARCKYRPAWRRSCKRALIVCHRRNAVHYRKRRWWDGCSGTGSSHTSRSAARRGMRM